MTVSNLSTSGSFNFDALTDISVEINHMLKCLADQKSITIKKEDDDTDLKLETKYEIDYDDNDVPPPPNTETIEDDLNIEPESMNEKSNRIGDVAELTIETATEIENSDKIKK